jgi:membrane protein
MLIVVAAIYHICPDRRYRRWQWVTPGSVFAVLMWLLVSLGFKAYVDNFGDYNKVYGSIAGVIVLMLWFYWSGMMLLLGGEINAEIESAAERKAAAADRRQAKQAA